MSQKPSVIYTDNNIDYRILNENLELELDTKFNNVVNFIHSNNGRGKSDKEKDGLYKEAQNLYSDYSSLLKDVKYNLNVNKNQLNYLKTLIGEELEYDVNTAFIAIELDNLLKSMNVDNFNTDSLSVLSIDATEITYVYHLISTHKVKGLNEKTFLFTDILRKIGATSKVFNYYDTIAKDLSTEILDWVALFDAGVSVEPKLVNEIEFEEVK